MKGRFHFGTKAPSDADLLRAMYDGIDTLVTAKHAETRWDAKIDTDALKDFIKERALARGLQVNNLREANGIPFELQARTQADAVSEALIAVSPDHKLTTLPLTAPVERPDGTVITRYKVRSPVSVENRGRAVPVSDDYLTILQRPDGTYQAQIGQLRQTFSAQVNGAGQYIPVALKDAPRFDEQLVTKMIDNLRQRAEIDLDDVRKFGNDNEPHWYTSSQTNVAPRVNPSRHEQVETKGLYANSKTYAAGAYEQLKQGKDIVEFVWRKGRLTISLQAGDMTYYAPVQPDGTVGGLTRLSTVV